MKSSILDGISSLIGLFFQPGAFLGFLRIMDLDPQCEACMHPQRKRAHTCGRAKPVSATGVERRPSSYSNEELWRSETYPGSVSTETQEMMQCGNLIGCGIWFPVDLFALEGPDGKRCLPRVCWRCQGIELEPTGVMRPPAL